MFLWLLLTFLRTLYGFLRTKSSCFRTFLVFSELVPELLACVSELVPELFGLCFRTSSRTFHSCSRTCFRTCHIFYEVSLEVSLVRLHF